MARPTDYTVELAERICERLADGESLRAIGCDPDFPAQGTIYRWLANDTQFREMYTRARETQADTLFDEMLDIADDATNDWMERAPEDKRGAGWDLNGDHVRRTQLRLDTRKWMAAKLRPRKYSDRMTHAGDPDQPVAIAHIRRTVVDPRKLDD